VTGAETSSHSAVREVTIRFPQIDAAGIVFYPRYFEMAQRCFPDCPLSTVPFAVTTEFLRPNRLGDVLDLVYRYASREDWSLTGRMQEQCCFRMTPMDDAKSLADDAHRPERRGFRTREETLGDWALDRSGRVHLSRYFEFLNMAIEEWIEDTLDMPFHALHVGRRVGIPTVRFDTAVAELPSGGASVSTWIRPVKLGERAMTFTSWFVADGRCVVENRQVVVFVEMREAGYASTRIPGDIAGAFAAQIDTSEAC
jgi:acyl-CoA thioesterase FadM